VALVLTGLVAPSATPLRSAAATESDLAWVSISPLPAARLNEAVTITLDVTGGSAPYAISVVAGALPAGLTVSGMALSGTPTSTGTSSFTLRATDAASATVDRAFELSIVRGVRQVALQSPTNTRIVLGNLASRTQASSTGTSASVVPNPLTKGWVTVSGAAAPYTVTGVDSRSNQTYSFQTDFNYTSATRSMAEGG
jgi:large repetitive protein